VQLVSVRRRNKSVELFEGLAYLFIFAAKGMSCNLCLRDSHRLFIAIILKGGIAASVLRVQMVTITS
jgi:hypothetical protein